MLLDLLVPLCPLHKGKIAELVKIKERMEAVLTVYGAELQHSR
jgi:hypothetical protein